MKSSSDYRLSSHGLRLWPHVTTIKIQPPLNSPQCIGQWSKLTQRNTADVIPCPDNIGQDRERESICLSLSLCFFSVVGVFDDSKELLFLLFLFFVLFFCRSWGWKRNNNLGKISSTYDVSETWTKTQFRRREII